MPARWIGLILGLVWCSGLAAEDWPMWRYDAYRSASSTNQLKSEQLRPFWSLSLGARKPAWDDTLNRDLMSYDRLLEPVVMNGRIYLGLNDRDQVVAYDLASGNLLTSYFCDGPVRMPPVAWQGRVYCASDDGFLHCLEADSLKLAWKFRGAPHISSVARQLGSISATDSLGRLSLGNQRLISAWPMRGGPVIRDGHLYIAASIWPFMGTFIYSLNAQTGSVEWCNDETGAQYIRQPHSAPAFAGVAPQGALVATEQALIVPGGRSVPAVFDRATGQLRYFELNAGGKGTGGSLVMADDASWYVHTRLRGTREFALETGLKTAFMPNEPVLAGALLYTSERVEERDLVVAYNSQTKEKVWELAANASGDLIRMNDHLVAAGSASAGKSTIQIIALPKNEQPARLVSSIEVDGRVERLLAADGIVLAVTLEGTIHALSSLPNAESALAPAKSELAISNPPANTVRSAVTELAKSLRSAGNAEGYAVLLGAEDSAIVEALSHDSPFAELSIFEADAARVDAWRRELDRRGVYGKITVHQSTLSNLFLPPYLANELFVSPAMTQAVLKQPSELARLYESVRPYGGALCLVATATTEPAATAAQLEQIRSEVAGCNLAKAEIELQTWGVVIKRVGSLPGSGTWTHQYGDMANSLKSEDQLVKLPLGVLWYGGVTHEDVLPRHGHGPPEQVVDGRLFIEGINTLTARDVYTGRVLWQRKFEDLGTQDVYFDETYKETPLDPSYNQVHIPGANGRGTNYVVTREHIYLVEGATCHVLDTATGQTLFDIHMPSNESGDVNEWGYVGVLDDVLIGGRGFAKFRARQAIEDDAEKLTGNKAGFGAKSFDRAASMALVGFDRHTGKQLWQVDAHHSFWHNGIVGGNGRIFAMDKNPKPVEDFLRRRGRSNPKTYRIACFDLRSGATLWEQQGDVFGSWLGYSAKHDRLLQAGAAASDRLASEVGQGMSVLDGANGQTVWAKTDLKYSGPCVLFDDLIITNANAYTESAGAFYLKDGSPKMTKNPLTGQLEPWKITRAYGCNSIIASSNLLTFRSGAAGFYDMQTEAGTGNLGGFRSGCTSNLIAADGVLNAPDYTRTCSCSYQNQTSLALVHMPELDAWTISNSATLEPKSGRLQQIGINLGAPGDRRAPDGRMWLEYPSVAGEAPNIQLNWEGDARLFQDHPSWLPDASLPWVQTSGLEGMSSLKISLVAQPRDKLATGWPIQNVADDAEENKAGEVFLDSSGIELGQDGTEPQWVAFKFNELPLAKGTKIRAAHLQLTSKGKYEDEATFEISAEGSANPLPLDSDAAKLSQRSLTNAKVTWKAEKWNDENEAKEPERSPDLSSLIQEVVDRDDWTPGSSIVLLIRGSGTRSAAAFRGRDSGAARLIIDADEVPPLDESQVQPQAYRVRLHFALPQLSASEPREFDVDVAGQSKLESIRLGGSQPAWHVETIERVELRNWLELKFNSKHGKPVICGIELERL